MKQANAKQKQWMCDIAEWAMENLSAIYGKEYNDGNCDFEIHHVVGRTGKQNKVAIGHEFILPVPFELHNVMSNHPDNVTHFKKNFVKRFGTQRELFKKLVDAMRECGYQVPSDDILEAIQSTNA